MKSYNRSQNTRTLVLEDQLWSVSTYVRWYMFQALVVSKRRQTSNWRDLEKRDVHLVLGYQDVLCRLNYFSLLWYGLKIKWLSFRDTWGYRFLLAARRFKIALFPEENHPRHSWTVHSGADGEPAFQAKPLRHCWCVRNFLGDQIRWAIYIPLTRNKNGQTTPCQLVQPLDFWTIKKYHCCISKFICNAWWFRQVPRPK